MGTIDIDYTSLGVGLLLLLIPVYFLWRFKTGLLKPILIGAVRMIIQLFFIGVYLRFLFEWNNPFINFLWVIIMVGVAAETAVTRTRLKRHILMIPVSVGFLVTVVLVGLYFLGFVLRLDNIFSAQMDNFALLGLEEELYHKRVHEVSGGQRQRIMLAVTEVLNKSILIVDEPTSALDPSSCDRVIDFFRSLCGKGMTVLAVSHDKQFAAGCNHIFNL